jgi:hypothetical protein
MGWVDSVSGDQAVAGLAAGGTLVFHAWDVFPSRSGGMERVECVIRGLGSGYQAACEVLPAEFGQRAETWTEAWTEAELRAKLDAVRASEEPGWRWG